MKSVASKNANEKIKIVRDEFARLDQAQRTRAMVLWVYDLDANSRFPGQHISPSSSIIHAMMDDPELLTDPSELKRMIETENDPRKFYIMCAPASQLMSRQKADFIVEISHMLFRHGAVASTVPSDYYRPSYKDASYTAYEMILGNLRLLEAGFVPPDEKLPYENRIPVLVDWLRHNWPGCEKLGLEEKAARPSPAPEATREEKKTRNPDDTQRQEEGPKNVIWVIAAMAAVIVALFAWLKRRKA